MRKLGYLFIAIIITAFAINEANAQRRGGERSNNNRERVRTHHRPTVRTRVVPRVRTRVVPRVNRFNRGFRGSGGIYYNRFNRPFNARGFYVPFRTHTLLFPNSNGFNTLESVEAQQEALDNLYERIRAKRLAKFLNRPNKRNKKRLVKYNILTGREADDISS